MKCSIVLFNTHELIHYAKNPGGGGSQSQGAQTKRQMLPPSLCPLKETLLSIGNINSLADNAKTNGAL